MQCVELCRAEDHKYASIHMQSNGCQCMEELPSSLTIYHPYICEGKPYEVYDVEAFDESQHCDHLYFKKQVHFWSEYKIAGATGNCKYSQPSARSGSSWNQKTEKLGRNSLMFADKLSRQSPAQGVQVKFGSASTYDNLWASTDHVLTLPWTLNSGFGKTSSERLEFKFGNPDRTAMIWGLQFLKVQVESLGGIPNLEMSYRYYKDVARGAYTATDYRSTDDLTQQVATKSITLNEINENGIYFFKDPQNNQKTQVIIASEVMMKFNVGNTLNFDFIGTFYDFQTASTGKHTDNKDDDWNSAVIGEFWVTGK